MVMAEQLTSEWLSRLQADYPDEPSAVYHSVTQWLLGESPERFEALSADELRIARQAIEYRYRVLQQRYWAVSSEQGYRSLIKRLSSLFLIRNKVKTWIALSRDRRRTVVDVIQEVIQEMIRSDRHLLQQLQWIATCTPNRRLRNILMLASLEEYCLRPIRNQPLIAYRFVNYLRRNQKGGMTQVPSGELIRLISEEIAPEDTDEALSLLDIQAWNQFQEEQATLEQKLERNQVKQSFTNYLNRNLGEPAAQWLDLHLKGMSQEQIAQTLDMPVQQVYRLREKISYHALRIFALKEQPTLVLNWLKTSLQDHHFGLTPGQWQKFWQQLEPQQQIILQGYQTDESADSIARSLGIKPKQVQTQWIQLYLAAQSYRDPPNTP
jgi:DNA-directed RNA polymerase specialized sigma24 family protein